MVSIAKRPHQAAACCSLHFIRSSIRCVLASNVERFSNASSAPDLISASSDFLFIAELHLLKKSLRSLNIQFFTLSS
jgi:hypothetical protein